MLHQFSESLRIDGVGESSLLAIYESMAIDLYVLLVRKYCGHIIRLSKFCSE